MPLDSLHAAMLAKAATSCLTPRDVETLRFDPYPEGHALEIYPKWAGFKIPYFKLDGNVDPDIYRFRFLQKKPSTGFAAIAEGPSKEKRYSQPGGTDCGVYLPPLLDVPWRTVAKDAAHAVVITEGELKAACACKYGIATIGLGGVYNWRSTKNRQELLPVLDKFEWTKRSVYIAFDSDIHQNPMVRVAASRLAATLARRGALVHLTDIPPNAEGAKQGIDDYIAARQAEYRAIHPESKSRRQSSPDAAEQYAIGQLAALLQESEPIGIGEHLHRLNGEVGIVRSTSEIVELATGNVYAPATFTGSLYRDRTYEEPNPSGKGVTMKFAAAEWLAWPRRTTFTHLDYNPGCRDMITEEGAYNSWHAQRWPLVAAKGSVAPWLKLFDHVFSTLTPEQRLWLKRWFAYPIQHPGTKLATAILVWGRSTGTGKSRIGETMRKIYGKNYGTVTNTQLASNFNEWAENKQFIVGDEISIGDKRGLANNLKDMITRQTLSLNIKNRKSYVVRDCMNFYFTSNHEDALYLEATDRRIFVVHADIQPLPDDFYATYSKWLEADGAARLFHHLLYEVDLGDFNPNAKAPSTAAKLEMTATSRSDAEDWACSLILDPDRTLGDRHPYDLFTAKDLLRIYDPEERKNIRANGMSRALNAAGAVKTTNGSSNAVVAGARDRVYAVRNVERYLKMTAKQVGTAYAAERSGVRGVGGSERFRRVQ